LHDVGRVGRMRASRVEEDELGGHDQASRDGQPPAHTAEYVLTGRPLVQAERLAQLTGPRLGAPLRMTEQAGDHDEVPRAGRVLAGRGELAGQARPGADRAGLAGDITPAPRAVPGSGWSSVASIRIVVVVATA
jgi:hypothetical protein